MTLKELSPQYRAQAEVLRGRVRELRERLDWQPMTEEERRAVEERVRVLTILWREARDLAVLTERYYERGYRRNAKYTL